MSELEAPALWIGRVDAQDPAILSLVVEMVAEIPQRYGEVLDAAVQAIRVEHVITAND